VIEIFDLPRAHGLEDHAGIVLDERLLGTGRNALSNRPQNLSTIRAHESTAPCDSFRLGRVNDSRAARQRDPVHFAASGGGEPCRMFEHRVCTAGATALCSRTTISGLAG
jgi:hypothetical protein